MAAFGGRRGPVCPWVSGGRTTDCKQRPYRVRRGGQPGRVGGESRYGPQRNNEAGGRCPRPERGDLLRPEPEGQRKAVPPRLRKVTRWGVPHHLGPDGALGSGAFEGGRQRVVWRDAAAGKQGWRRGAAQGVGHLHQLPLRPPFLRGDGAGQAQEALGPWPHLLQEPDRAAAGRVGPDGGPP